MVSNININFSVSLPGTVNRSAAHCSPTQTTRGHEGSAEISTLGCWQMICAIIFQQDILKEKAFLSLCVLVRTSKACLRSQTGFYLDIFAVIN